ncbi:carboxypeptidase regulatory-like domain-containing protein, partial [bacterium]|nr:carboxypeptidase regulatory-like domain-containing protein [bacterium]
MKRVSLSLMMLLLMLSVTFARIDHVDYSSNLPMKVESRQISDQGMRLTLTMEAPEWRSMGELDQAIDIASYLNGGMVEEPGYPSVPVTGRLFRIPPTSAVEVEVINAEYELLTGVDYAIYTGDKLEEGWGEVKSPNDAWYPENIASAAPPAVLHDFRVSNLSIYPVQVNTARREVRVYSNVEVQVTFEGQDDRATLPHYPDKISESYLPWYRLFLDWDDSELDEFELYRGGVQVVMKDDDNLWEAMEPWIEWKRQKGWELSFLTDDDVNWNANSIHNELRDRWEAADPKFDYVVIIGDNTGVFSTPQGTNPINNPPIGNCGDYQYSLMTEDDILQDVAVGRISVESSQDVAKYVSKVLKYERTPYMDETDWYKHGAVMAVTHYSGLSTILVGQYWKSEMENAGYTQVDTAWSNGAEPARSETIDHLNAGVSMFNFRGGIADGLNTNQIGNLTNNNMPFVACDVTCATGNWVNSYGMNEAYMRAGSVQTPKGGIGGMGTASSYTNTGRNNCLSGGLGFTLLNLRQPALGDGLFGSKMNLYVNYFDFAPEEFRGFSERFNLMGDPLVWVWTDIPQMMEAEYPETIMLGTNTFAVSSLEDEAGVIDGAWVTLYKVDGDEEVIAKGVTQADGSIILDAPIRYEGEAILTITAPNHHPLIDTLDVISPDAALGYIEYAILDDGENGTMGNDNGIPEAGETVGLSLTLKNYGTDTETNITITPTIDDEWAIVSGTATLESIDSGAEADAEGMILVEVAPEVQHDWILHINLSIETEAGEFIDDLPITAQAPKFAYMNLSGLNNWDPGEQADIEIRVRNIGGSSASASTAILESLDPFLGVPQDEATFASMNMGQERTSSEFTIAMHAETIPGRRAKANLIITTEDGATDTVAIWIDLGTKAGTDPSGPDRYGYYGFDNTDTAYDLAPEYDWIEIVPTENNNDYDGELLDIDDPGNNLDETILMDLPFPVQYYGETFEEMSVSSNGWIAMGNNAQYKNMRNWTIPSPLGPYNMIAPYWDERRIRANNAGVYYYYDEPNGRFIVTWKDVTDLTANQALNPCTFQLIIYGQVEGHYTYTGDHEIIFQYEEMNHTGGPTQGHGTVPWWTTGIENGNQDDGIQYSYWNEASPGAQDVEEGLAIRWTTNVALITGTVSGQVTHFESMDPVVGATVFTSDYVYSAETDEDGNYSIDEIVIGDHEFVVEAIGYNNSYSGMYEVFEDENTVVNFGPDFENEGLRHPEFNIDTQAITFELPPDDSTDTTVNLNNTGNGPLEYSFRILFNDPEQNVGGGDYGDCELDDPWDPHYDFELTDEETRNRAVTYMGSEFWVAGSVNNDIGYNKLYRYNKDGELLGSYNQPVDNHSSSGFFDLTTDGRYLYGADRGDIFKMEFDGNTVIAVDQMDCPVNNVRAMAYDSNSDWLWLSGRIDETLYAIDMNGDVHYSYDVEDYYVQGLGIHPDDPDGYTLYLISQDSDDDNYHMLKMRPETGEVLEVYDFPVPGDPTGGEITNMFNPLIWTYMTVMDNGNADYVQI